MGFRVLLVAVSGKEPTAIHKDLGVVATQEFEEIAESPIVGAKLSNGSYLLYINDKKMISPSKKMFARLSKGAKLLACYVNYVPVQDRLLAKQVGSEDCDYVFDIPVEVVKELGGFRYDTDIEGSEAKPFQVLKKA